MNAVEMKINNNIIDFAAYAEARVASELAAQAAHAAECARRARLECVLSDLLAELEAA
jgi:hypothetical protein